MKPIIYDGLNESINNEMVKDMMLLRKSAVCERLGLPPTTLQERINYGFFPKPLKDGRNSNWPDYEVREIQASIIRGENDELRKKLVIQLEADRKQFSLAE